MEITKREQAIEAGQSTYTNGKPCPRGHYVRYTMSAACVECAKVAKVESQRRAREKFEAAKAAHAGPG